MAINWVSTVYMGFLHLTTIFYIIYCIWTRDFPSFLTLTASFLLWPITGLGITAGAHRLWSHKSYKAHFIVEMFLLILQTMTLQRSVLTWVRDHRLHHLHSDTDLDPHSIQKGLFYSHIGWILEKKRPEIYNAGKKLDVSDITERWWLRFQHKYYMVLGPLLGIILPTVIGRYFGIPWHHSFFCLVYIRLLCVYHATWCVNSLAHYKGTQPYSLRGEARENPLVALLAIGEGWHNYHHKYPFDYATSEFGITGQINFTKFIIDIFWFFGLVTHCKRANAKRLPVQPVIS